jgi:polyferredoxin
MLCVFLWLLLQTMFRGSVAAADGGELRLPLAVEAFFLFDPFVALITFLSTHTVYRSLLLSLIVVAVTLVFGRAFCGWICPFGTLHQLVGWTSAARAHKLAARVAANRTHPVRQRVKYYLLYASVGAAIAGSALGGLLDPLSFAVRSIGLSVLPVLQLLTGGALDLARETGSRPLIWGADAAQDALTRIVWQPTQFFFHEGWTLGALFIAVLLVNRLIPRFWCRVLCPLGALLGLVSRHALFGMQKDHAKCTDCNQCLKHCQGADSPQGGVKWRQDECHMCLNCENACPEDVIKFRFLPSRTSTTTEPDTQRRTSITAIASGLAVVPLARAADGFSTNANPHLLRPPGALPESEFLDRCVRCGECMKVCPNNALHPALLQGGVEGLWTPVVIPRIGYCEQLCVLCGDVCPTGAIAKFRQAERVGAEQPPIKIGTAFYNRGRCLPWAMQIPCIVCEEFCPTSPKAIWVEQVEAPVREREHGEGGAPPKMSTVQLQRPHVDPALCIGCGACEKVCPVQDEPAIRVTSVGESRSRTHAFLLASRGRG